MPTVYRIELLNHIVVPSEPPEALARALHDHDAVDRACEADLRALGFDGLTAERRAEIEDRHAFSVEATLRAIVDGAGAPSWIESHDVACDYAGGDPDGEILGGVGIDRLRRAWGRLRKGGWGEAPHARLVRRRTDGLTSRAADASRATDADLRLAATAVARAVRWWRRREARARCR